MTRFSQRVGAVRASSVIQLETMSDALRNSIWNSIVALFDGGESGWWGITQNSCHFFFKLPVDELPNYNIRRREWVKDRVYAMEWHGVYDYVEFIAEWYEKTLEYPRFRKAQIQAEFNRIFEDELSGYRFINGQLVPVSDASEVGEIETALTTASRVGLLGAHAHISSALKLLAKRPDPDYRNSIKESISAVEAVAKQLGAKDSQGLSGALAELGKKVPLHGGFRAGLLSLYGYTSDEGGIRHAMLEEPSLGHDEAKYMAVVCSAFVNFLVSKAHAAGLLRK
jgi:hypothetical protein